MLTWPVAIAMLVCFDAIEMQSANEQAQNERCAFHCVGLHFVFVACILCFFHSLCQMANVNVTRQFSMYVVCDIWYCTGGERLHGHKKCK